MSKNQVKITGGALLIAGLGGLALALYKGWIKLPDFGGWLSSKVLPGDVGRGAAEGMKEGGLPGAVGGMTYNVFTPGGNTLRERVIERYIDVAREEGISEEAAFSKTVAEEAASDVEKGAFGTGFWGNLFPPFAGYTIGAGLGALSQWQQYLDSLPPEKRKVARQKEFFQRAAWMKEHPVETSIGAPAALIHDIMRPPGAPAAPIQFMTPGLAALQVVSRILKPKPKPTGRAVGMISVLADTKATIPVGPVGPSERRLALPVSIQKSTTRLTKYIAERRATEPTPLRRITGKRGGAIGAILSRGK